jgi:hypothetical protein
MWDKKTWKSTLPNSTSAVQPHCSFTNNLHQVSAEARSQKMKESTARTNHDPRMNRISSIVLYELPPTTASIRHSWYLKYLVWLLQLFVDCLVCSRYCLQLLWVFLECVLLPCACARFWPLGLKNPQVCKTLNRKPLKNVFSLSFIYVSSSSIRKLLVKLQL